MSSPKVSVIMPTYNRAAYLREAIESVLAQRLGDLELIVVDDGSSDDTAGVLAAVRDPRVRYVRQEHRGVSAAANRGLRMARGQYIGRLDSDDLWVPETLQTLAEVLDSKPEVGVAYAKGQAMDSGGKLLPHTHGMAPRFPGEALRSLVYEDFTCNIATLARRSCFDRAGEYDESLPASEDWDMWLRIAAQDQFAFVDRILGHFRWHDGNMTGPASPLFEAVLQTRTRPLDKVFARPDVPDAVSAMKSRAYENIYLFRCLRWLQAHNFRAAWREASRAVRGSEHRLITVVRLGWFFLVANVLGRFVLGRRLADGLTAGRRRLLGW